MPEYQEVEAGSAVVNDIYQAMVDIARGSAPTALEEGKRILRRFDQAVAAYPNEFVNEKADRALQCLEKAIEGCGVTLAQLGTSRKKLTHKIRVSMSA